jgi:TMEM175 potassium channel family protein
MTMGRLESFSDAVIAVAITLLALDIHVPSPESGSLAHELARQWPQYAAYVVSFVTIGIIWINHHWMIRRLGEADRTILLLNLLLLVCIGVLPFGTSLMADYLRAEQGQSLAAAIYSGLFLLMSIAFALLNRHILLRKAHLLNEQIPESRRRQILFRSVVGLLPYVLATALAAVSPYITLIICAAVAIFYTLPIASGGAEA